MSPCATVQRALLATGLATAVLAGATGAQQPQDTTFSRLVQAYTTDPRFLPRSVVALPLSAA